MDGVVEKIDAQVTFDLNGDGSEEIYCEWFGPKEGILVDSTYPGCDDAELSGYHLYGDLGGKQADGFYKLALHDFNNDGLVTADELEGLMTWKDGNTDAHVDDGELHALEEYRIVAQDLWFSRR